MRRQHRGIASRPCGKVLICYLVAATALSGAPPREAVAALAPTALAPPGRGTGRAEDLARLQSLLEQKVVAQRLADLGFSAEEIRARLEALDDRRLHELAQRVDGLVPAGQDKSLALIFYAPILALYLVYYLLYGVFYSISWIVRSLSGPETPKGEESAPETPTAEDAPTGGEAGEGPGTPTGCEPGSYLYRCMRYLEEGEVESAPETPTGPAGDPLPQSGGDAPTGGEVEP